MSRFQTYLKHGIQIVFLAGLVLFAFSFIRPNYLARYHSQVSRVERALRSRERVAEKYALKALELADQDWIDFDDLPEDIVLYVYQDDTLKSWTHQFPINSDDIVGLPYSYRLRFMSNRNLFSVPLSYLGVREQYVNLGSAWYVVTTQISRDRSTKVITGILVKTEYTSGNIPNTVNRKLHLGDGFTTVSINNDDTAIVYGIEDEPLFSIVPDGPIPMDQGNMTLRLVAFAVMVFSAFLYHFRRRRWRSFWLATAVAVVVRSLIFLYVMEGSIGGEMFSPLLYADSNLMNSLGSLLLNNVFVALEIFSLFVMRFSLLHRIEAKNKTRRKISVGVFALLCLMLAWYIHFTLRSLILNSSITLEPHRTSDLSYYSLLCYMTYAMLFLALLEMVQMVVTFIRKDSEVNLFSWRNLLIYIGLISAYTVSAVSVFGLDKEYETNRIKTAKLAIERDLSLEMFLRNVEPAIASDPFISVLSSVNGVELIKNRLMERYLYNDILQNFNVTITCCAPDNLIAFGNSDEPIGCFKFYDDMIAEYGIQLAPGSNMFYLNNYNGLASYLGVFTYLDDNLNVSRLFLEVESKYKNNVASNPLDALNVHSRQNASQDRYYSYARYSNGKIVSYGGRYDYPVVPPDQYGPGYRMVRSNGYLHFINRLSDEDLTVLTRVRRPALPYIISFSYLFIFFGLFLGLCSRWARREKLFNLPKHSLKRKITLLTTGSMVVALLCMGIGSIVYVMRLNTGNDREQMESMISSVQASLEEKCKFAMRYTDLNPSELFGSMDNISMITRCDINLYNTAGELMRSTKPELFDQFIVGKRMNNQAYRSICKQRSLRHIMIEEILGIKFFSIYAPLCNSNGDVVAVVNVPYFDKSEDITSSTVSTISIIANIYILLLLAALVIGAILSNSMTRPLAEIKDRLDRLATGGSKKLHIQYYNSKDELGTLISSYNKMVDDLEESTRKLAQSEREQAWKEMARQIAHEIKNPLTPMRLSIQHLMRLKHTNAPGWEDRLESVSKSLLEEIDTLSQTATEFSSFARFYSEEITQVDLVNLLKEQTGLFDNRDDIEIQFDNRVGEMALIEGRRSQIARVFVNLMTNSIQAIDSASIGNGRLKVTLTDAEVSGNMCYRIDFEDNGPGVSEDNLDKLFTPNFTTKSSGTGLGLAISRSIVEQTQGTISYARSEMGGACFTIMLPVI